MSTSNNLLLLNFVVTNKETDNWFYTDFKSLKKHLTRREMIQVIKAVKSNPRAYSDTGINYVITDGNASVHSVQWSY